MRIRIDDIIRMLNFIMRTMHFLFSLKSSFEMISGREAFKLIIHNPVRTFVLNKMVDFLLFLGKFVIIAAATTASYAVFRGWFPEIAGDIPTLNFFFTPLICITVGTYFISSAFFGVYHMAVDTIYLSLLQDLKQNDGSPEKPYMMTKGNLTRMTSVSSSFILYITSCIEIQNLIRFYSSCIVDLQETMGVMQKFREKELNYRRERLEAENAELQQMLENNPHLRH